MPTLATYRAFLPPVIISYDCMTEVGKLVVKRTVVVVDPLFLGRLRSSVRESLLVFAEELAEELPKALAPRFRSKFKK